MQVSGPKTDIWLVKTVAVLLLAICAGLLAAIVLRSYHWPVIIMAMSSCFVLLIIDLYYVLSGTISRVYLGDAFIELVLLLLYIIMCFRVRSANAEG
jgi:hypothetical protein